MTKKPKNGAWTRNPRSVREHLGFDLRDWARILGVNAKTIERWETGETAPVGLAAEVFRGFASALDAGADPADVRNRITLGLGAFLAHGLTKGLRP